MVFVLKFEYSFSSSQWPHIIRIQLKCWVDRQVIHPHQLFTGEIRALTFSFGFFYCSPNFLFILMYVYGCRTIIWNFTYLHGHRCSFVHKTVLVAGDSLCAQLVLVIILFLRFPSSKMSILLIHLDGSLNEGNKAIIFSCNFADQTIFHLIHFISIIFKWSKINNK